ncbi:MAG TPA: hypothetical protein VGF28_19365 [Thermoanaerobaculia bacterium]
MLDGPTTIRALRQLNPNVRVIGTSGSTRHGTSGPCPISCFNPSVQPSCLNAIQSLLSRSE